MSQMSNTDQALSRAYDLIEQDQQAEAAAILKPLLTENANNPSVWWLYAHAVDDAETARAAIDTVLRLDANYPGAVELKQSLDDMLPAVKTPTISRLTTPSTIPPKPDLPETSAQRPVAASTVARSGVTDVDDMPDFSTPALGSKRGGSRLPLLLGLGVVAVIVIGVAILLLRPAPNPNVPISVAQGRTPTDLPAIVEEEAETETATTEATIIETEEAAAEFPTSQVEPSEAANAVTEEADATAESENTVEASTAADNVGSAALTAAFADFTLDEVPTERSQTDLGETLLMRICGSLSGASLRTALMEGMSTLAEESANIDDDIEALGIRVIDCEGSGATRAFAVAVDAARDFAQGDLDAADFQGSWRPVA
jgi:hypothetical protein